jgi:hypothetical protein
MFSRFLDRFWYDSAGACMSSGMLCFGRYLAEYEVMPPTPWQCLLWRLPKSVGLYPSLTYYESVRAGKRDISLASEYPWGNHLGQHLVTAHLPLHTGSLYPHGYKIIVTPLQPRLRAAVTRFSASESESFIKS